MIGCAVGAKWFGEMRLCAYCRLQVDHGGWEIDEEGRR